MKSKLERLEEKAQRARKKYKRVRDERIEKLDIFNYATPSNFDRLYRKYMRAIRKEERAEYYAQVAEEKYGMAKGSTEIAE